MRLVITFLMAIFLTGGMALARPPDQPEYRKIEKLFSGGETIVGETIDYPVGKPVEIQSLIVTLKSGESTGWHKHGVPTYGFILAGSVTVDYGDKGKRTYRAGEAFMEAMDYWHDGVNTGALPVRILVVFMGAKGQKPVIHDGAPK